MIQYYELNGVLNFFSFELDSQLRGADHGALKLENARLIVNVAFSKESEVIKPHYICISFTPLAYSELGLKRA
ncbi:hypothetical protein PU99_28840 [Pseudomonas putida]|nr:hypothetical protein PU99_28840 [Pseudomonas putida]